MENYYTKEALSRKALLADPDFVKDAREFLRGRTKKEYEDNDELFNAFVEHMRVGTISEITAIRDRSYVKKADEDSKAQAGRLFLTFDRLEKGSTSVGTMIGDYAEGLARSPSTFASIIPGVGWLGKGAARGVSKGLTETTRLLATQSIKKQAAKGAAQAAAIEATVGGIQGAAYTGARKATGFETLGERSVLAGTTIGALAGAVPGAVIGGVAGGVVAKQEARAIQDILAGEAAKSSKLEAGRLAKKALFKDKKAAKIAKALGNRLKPLDKSMVEAGGLLRGVGEDFRLSINPEVLNNIEGALVELLIKVGASAEDVADKRVSQIIGDALSKGIDVDDLKPEFNPTQLQDIVDIQNKYGLTAQQFGQIFVSEMSDAGRTLGLAGRLSKANKQKVGELINESNLLSKAGVTTVELAEEYKTLDAASLAKWVNNLDKARLGFMTVQTATTMRNIIGGGGRTALYLLDNMFRGSLEAIDPFSSPQLRKIGRARIASGARAIKSLTFNSSEAKALSLLFHEEMPERFSRVFRANADIAAAIGPGSGLANFSKKLNILNTFADNGIKRAVFMAELQTQVGGKKALREILRKGEFSDIHEGQLNQAIKEATSVVYQRTYKEKLFKLDKTGKFIQVTKEYPDRGTASKILNLFSSPATTWAIPFPKFVANSIEFMWTHAPVIGLASRGTVPEKIGKQLTGTALLYGAIQLRAAQGPEARWYEMFNKETKQFSDAMPLYGPFAPFMLAADIILRAMGFGTEEKKDGTYGIKNTPLIAGTKQYRTEITSDWKRIINDPAYEQMFNEPFFRDFLKATFGTTFRTGIGLDFMKDFEDDMREATIKRGEGGDIQFRDTVFNDATKRATARFLGNWANTFMVAGGEIRDFYSMVDPQYEKIRDPNVITNGFWATLAAQSLRSLPISDEGNYLGLIQGPEGIETLAMSPARREELRREGRDVTQLTGLGAQQIRSDVERELNRLDIPLYKAYKSFRAMPSLNQKSKELYQQYTVNTLSKVLFSAEYTTKKDNALEQRLLFNKALSNMRIKVRDDLFSISAANYRRNPTDKKAQEEVIFLLNMKFDASNSKDIRRLTRQTFKSRYGRSASTTGEQGVKDMQTLISMATTLR